MSMPIPSSLLRNAAAAGSLIALLALPFTASSAPTQAGSWYLGLQAGMAEFDQDGEDDEWEPWIATGRIGFFPTNQIAFETRLGTGLSDDEANNRDLDLEHLIGTYIVAHTLTYQNSFSLYFLGGLTQAEFDDGPLSELEIGFGAGLDIYLDNDLALNIEYMRYQNDADGNYDFSSINAGVTWFH
ncbi:outer membrane beta-barrel protein [Halorhodospira halochloris]|uniref:outer membrane beta-barrel protein n=1 Tax=Halorhodospira halochloris TaxID=1052 RepID=UPI001EE7BF21|nr:outer membrane beta-barrel protein [Halorhodospira halochloris]MCG5549386.1 porin family protein [Halorhodospira halochloris]